MGNETTLNPQPDKGTRRFGDRLETVFSQIGETLVNQSAYMSEMNQGIQIIAGNTKVDKDDQDIDKLKKPKVKQESDGGLFKFLTGLMAGDLIGSIAGGMFGGLAGKTSALIMAGAGWAGRAMLVASMADKIGAFMTGTVEGVLKSFDMNSNDAEKYAQMAGDNITNGLWASILNKRLGLFTAIAGFGLDALQKFFEFDAINTPFGEININHTAVKGTIGAIMMMVVPALLKSAGAAVMASVAAIATPAVIAGAGIAAAAAAAVYGISYLYEKNNEAQQKMFDESISNLKRTIEENLNEGIRAQHVKNAESGILGMFKDGEHHVFEDISKLNSLGEEFLRKQRIFENRNNVAPEDMNRAETAQTSWGENYKVAARPIDTSIMDKTDPTYKKYFEDQRNNAINLLKTIDLNLLKENQLLEMASLASYYGTEDQKKAIQDKIDELGRLNPVQRGMLGITKSRAYDTDLTFEEIRDKAEGNQVRSESKYDEKSDQARVKLRPSAQAEYDKMFSDILMNTKRKQDSLFTTMLNDQGDISQSMNFHKLSQDQRDAIMALRSKASPINNLITPVNHSTNVRHGDTISTVTIINNGLGAQASLLNSGNMSPQY